MLVQPVTDGPHETPRLVENGIPFISVDAIVDNKIDFSRKRGDVSEEYDAECCKKYKPQYHDVYVVKSGSTVGKVAIVETTDRFNIWSPLAALRCEGKTKPYYLFYLLQTRRMQAQILDKASNGTQPNLSMRELEKFDVLVTDNAEEQQRIGDYFKSLDHLITLHQRKCQIDGCRFQSPLAITWEQRKVGDLLIERNQQAPMSDEYPLMAFIANEGVAQKGDRYDRSALVTDTANKLYKKTEIGDFIYSSNNLETGSIGLNKYGKACISPVYSIFEPTGIADSDFLGRRLVRKDFINAMVKWRQGVIYGQWRIHESDFLKIEIPVPSVVEQRKIGAYLDQLDRLITLHQCE